MRLIAGSSRHGDAAPLRAGVEIRVKPGWHTYWRYPGDAGVPPRFDFAGSQNVKAVDVLRPAPQAIPEEGLTVIGYTDNVILPLAVVPQNRAKPVTLRLKLDYAVYEKLCVPAEGKASGARRRRLLQDSRRTAAKRGCQEARARRRLTARGQVGSSRGGGDAARVIVDVAAPAGERVALFAEGPTPDWALPVPAPIEGAPSGTQRFAFDLDGAPAGARYEGAPITLTARAGSAAIEVVIRLD